MESYEYVDIKVMIIAELLKNKIRNFAPHFVRMLRNSSLSSYKERRVAGRTREVTSKFSLNCEDVTFH